MTPIFSLVITLVRDDVESTIRAGWCDRLPQFNQVTEHVTILYPDEGQQSAGMYLWTGQRWRFMMPYLAVNDGVNARGQFTARYGNNSADTVPAGSIVYRNGVQFLDTDLDAGPAIWGVITPSVDVGSVTSVNSVGPDGAGNVALGITDIPGLQTALDNAGAVKTVNDLSPDAQGNVDLDVGVLTINGNAPDAGGNIDVPSYTLPVATSSTLGGVKQGQGVAIAGDGTISVTSSGNQYVHVTGTGNAALADDTSIAIGVDAEVLPGISNAIAIGAAAVAEHDGSISIGATADAQGLNTVAIGAGASAGNDNSVALGAGSISNDVDAVSVGNPTTQRRIIYAAPGIAPTDVAVMSQIAAATTSTLGRVIVGSRLTVSAGTVNVPLATTTTPGVVKQGANTAIAADGTISVADPYVLQPPTMSAIGGVKQGTNIIIDPDGTINSSGGGGAVDSVNAKTGAVAITAGDNIAIDNSGASIVISATAPGGAVDSVNDKVGDVVIVAGANIVIDNSGAEIVVSATADPYTLPVATSSVLGGVKDGLGVTIAGDGTLSADLQSVNTKTGAVTITPGTGVTIDNTGASIVISSDPGPAPQDDMLYAQQNGEWTSFSAPTGTVLTELSSVPEGDVSLVQDNGTTDGVAIVKTLSAGPNVTLTDVDGVVTVAAALSAAVDTVNGVAPVAGNVQLDAADVGALALDGSNAMTSNLNAGTNRVVNAADPIDGQDLVTLAFLNTQTVIDSGTYA